jgi:DUF1365 family protein
MRPRSEICVGELIHARTDEVPDRFRYPVYFFAVDVDELPALSRELRLFASERPGVFSIRARDYQQAAAGLRASAVASARRHGVDGDIARVELVTQPRVLGYLFNPVSFFLCRGPDDDLVCAIAEVANTYGGRHRYVLTERERIPARRGTAYRTDKVFYVSPYIHRAATYDWVFDDDADRRSIAMDVRDAAGDRFFRAVMRGRRQPLTDAGLARLLVRYPLMTVQIISLIHWHAFKLRRRGVQHRPPPIGDTAR